MFYWLGRGEFLSPDMACEMARVAGRKDSAPPCASRYSLRRGKMVTSTVEAESWEAGGVVGSGKSLRAKGVVEQVAAGMGWMR